MSLSWRYYKMNSEVTTSIQVNDTYIWSMNGMKGDFLVEYIGRARDGCYNFLIIKYETNDEWNGASLSMPTFEVNYLEPAEEWKIVLWYI